LTRQTKRQYTSEKRKYEENANKLKQIESKLGKLNSQARKSVKPSKRLLSETTGRANPQRKGEAEKGTSNRKQQNTKT
jgi:hypothetical protein